MPRRAVTSTATRPRVAARVRRHRLTPDAHISARASHAHARLLAPWLTASLPALAPLCDPRLRHPSQPRLPAPRPAA